MANKTVATLVLAEDFLDAVAPEARRDEVRALDRIFRAASGFQPVMWGPAIVGYGRYRYRYESGREGELLATGFSPRKADLTIYIMPGYADLGDILKDLGPHRLGKSCLYLKGLADVDADVLARLIRAGLVNLGQRWPVLPR
jgi:Domain of unknown function (DU1801)